MMLSLQPQLHSIQIFVEQEPLQSSSPQGTYARMMDMDNDSTEFMSPAFPSAYGGQTSMPSSYPMECGEAGTAEPSRPFFSDYQYVPMHSVGASSSNVPEDCIPEDAMAGPSLPVKMEQLEDPEDDVGPSILPSSMAYAEIDDDGTGWVHEAKANNDDVPLEDAPIEENLEVEEPVHDGDIDATAAQNYAAHVADIDETRLATGIDGFEVGQKFANKDEFIRALSEWSLRRSVAFKGVRSQPNEYTAVCASNAKTNPQQCPGRIHTSTSRKHLYSAYFIIKSYNPLYICRNLSRATESKQLTTKFICQCILPCLKRRIDMTPTMIQDHMRRAYRWEIMYYKAWEGSDNAIW